MTNGKVPVWVSKEESGKLEPFDADRITRSLFASTKHIGNPDVFLARELADAVIHFLEKDNEAATISLERIVEVVYQVVREIGQSQIALAYLALTKSKSQEKKVGARPAFMEVMRASAQKYSLEHVYSSELVAAHQSGLLVIGGLEYPDKLEGCVCEVKNYSSTHEILGSIEKVSGVAGKTIAFDGLDQFGPAYVDSICADLLQGLRITGLNGVINLNVKRANDWLPSQHSVPLFQRANTPSGQNQSSEVLLKALVPYLCRSLRIDWHLDEKDFLPENNESLEKLIQLANNGANICFTFDHLDRPISLGEGMDRRSPANLLMVGLNLINIVGLLGEKKIDLDSYCRKLASLVRLAITAGIQKRRFLKESGSGFESGFLLDRSRLVLVPFGINPAVRLIGEVVPTHLQDAKIISQAVFSSLFDVIEEESKDFEIEINLNKSPQFQTPFAANLLSFDEILKMSSSASKRPVSDLFASEIVRCKDIEWGTLTLIQAWEEKTPESYLLKHVLPLLHRSRVNRLKLIGMGPEQKSLLFT